MIEFKCKECGGLQYSSCREKEKEPCIYCEGEVEINEHRTSNKTTEKGQRSSNKL